MIGRRLKRVSGFVVILFFFVCSFCENILIYVIMFCTFLYTFYSNVMLKICTNWINSNLGPTIQQN